jgi:hypothetical protein
LFAALGVLTPVGSQRLLGTVPARSPDSARVRAAALIAGGLALIPSVAAGQGADDTAATAPDDRVAIRIEYFAPAGCPLADDFEAEVRARTPRARSAVAGEPARVFHVEILDEKNAAVGRMVVEHDGERSGARVLRGKSCSEVSSALALTAALSIDPAARLVLEPAPAPVARAAPEPAPQPAPARAKLPEPSNVGVGLGASAGLARIVAPGLMPVASLFGELASPGRGALGPAVRISANVASNALDADRDATFTWVAAGLDLCPLRASLGRAVLVRPCVATQAGVLRGRGRNVAEPLGASRAWWSAGGSVHFEARLSSHVGVDLSGSALLPFREREFVFDTPPRDVARTATVSVGVGLGVFVLLL